MLTYKWKLTLVSGLVSIAIAACSFTTANTNNLKLYKDDAANTEATTFAAGDAVYGKVFVSNNPGKVKLKFRLIAEKVEGMTENQHLAEADRTVDVDGDGRASYTLTPPPSGWPPGTYRVEVGMLVESGEQKDQESINFTVAGGGARNAPVTTPASSTSQGGGGGDASGNSIGIVRLKLTANAKSNIDDPSESTFSPDDHVYVVYTAENVPAGGKIICNLYAEDVEGVKSGEQLRLLTYTNPTSAKFTDSFDLDPAKFGGSRWGKGTYRVVLEVQSNAGAPVQELKSINFTVE